MKTVFFRCNADEESGLGHFSRCLNIARGILSVFDSIQISFFGNYNPFSIALLEKYNLNFEKIDKKKQWNSDYNFELCSRCDYFILDSYLVDKKFISNIKVENCKLIVLDDFMQYDDPSVDLVVNFCINAEKRFEYKNPNTALGLNFFPAKPELKRIRISRLNKVSKEIQNILILMGGTDKYELGPKLIDPIQQLFQPSQIKLVTNSKHEIQNKNAMIFPFTTSVETFYEEADLVIHGGGLAKYESSYCLIPNISLALSENIQADSVIFSTENLCIDGGMAEHYREEYFLKTATMELTPNNISKFINAASQKFSTHSLDNLISRIIN